MKPASNLSRSSAAKAVKIQLTTPVLLRVVLVSMQIWPEGWHAGGGQGLET